MGKKGKSKKSNSSQKPPQQNGLKSVKVIDGCEHSGGAICNKKVTSALNNPEFFCMCCPKTESSPAAVALESLLMCLYCGKVGCSIDFEKHSLGHFERQPEHCLATYLCNGNSWCYKCSDLVIPQENGKFSELVSLIQDTVAAHFGLTREARETPTNENVDDMSEEQVLEPKVEIHQRSRPDNTALSSPKVHQKRRHIIVKGLNNLGNTCFFNSTIQCVYHAADFAKPLDEFLRQTHYRGPLPDDLAGSVVPLVDVANESAIASACRDLFRDLSSNGPNTAIVSPHKLFNSISHEVPRFRGRQQQDAHELLRYLLDSIKNEESKRLKRGFCKLLGVENVNPKRADEETKAKCQKIANVTRNQTCVDRTFGGTMVDTVVCRQCGHIKNIDQHFLDISLPLKPSRVQNQEDGSTNNKQNSAKNRKALRAEKKLRQAKEVTDPSQWDDATAELDEGLQSLDNMVESGMSASASNNGAGSPPLIAPERPDSGVGSVCSGSDSGGDIPPDTSPTSTTTASVAQSEDKGAAMATGSSPLNDGELLNTFSALSLDASSCDTADSVHYSRRLSNRKTRQPLQPLGRRVPPAESEKSLHAALYWFTEKEVLDGQNRYACAECGKAIGKPFQLTSATKQTWIGYPPRTLTLHLKRFEAIESGGGKSTRNGGGMSFRKISEPYTFPAILDMAPYMSPLHWPAHAPSSVRYALRGVVEHSGSLSGGHYVAYVRVADQESSVTKSLSNVDEAEVAAGPWYYISDSNVRETSFDNVLRASAFLLFYQLLDDSSSSRHSGLTNGVAVGNVSESDDS